MYPQIEQKKEKKKKHSFNNKRIHVSSYEEKIDAKINRNKQGFFGGEGGRSHSFINATCTNVHFLTLFLFKWFFLKRPSHIFYHCMEHLDSKGEPHYIKFLLKLKSSCYNQQQIYQIDEWCLISKFLSLAYSLKSSFFSISNSKHICYAFFLYIGKYLLD